MKAVSNAGPLMALGKLSLVHLLHQLYEQVLAPSAVHEEVVVRGLETRQPDAYAIQLAIARNEISVIHVDDNNLSDVVQSLPLGRGEKQTIHLGLQESADWTLLDDLIAREEAERLGLKVKETVGVITEAYRKGALSLQEVEIIFQAILDRGDIWISDALIRRILDELRTA